MQVPFLSSQDFSLGVELEIQLINLKNYDLSNLSKDLIDKIQNPKNLWKIKPESTQSMIEIGSSIHKNHMDLAQELNEIKNYLMNCCNELNIGLCGGGTHPFQQWQERKIFPKPRYLQLAKHHGFLIKMAIAFAEHIHISCQSGDQAIFLCHALSKYIPHFIALSGSSPFYQSIDTDFNSTRIMLRDFLPNSGKIPPFKNWAEFEQYFLKCREMGIIKTMKDVYWDVRPKPEFGTIEIRVCDMPLQIKKAVQLAAYAQSLVAFLSEENIGKFKEDPYITYQYNRFQAARFGLKAECVNHFDNKFYSLKEDILDTLKLIEPYSKNLGSDTLLLELASEVNDEINDSSRLRKIFSEQASLQKLIAEQLTLWIK